jgi:hypothetical protein
MIAKLHIVNGCWMWMRRPAAAMVLFALTCGGCGGGAPAEVSTPQGEGATAVTDEPVAWPEGTPERNLPEGFERIVAQAATEVDPPAELLEVDCQEAPCYAALRTAPTDGACKALTETDAWETYHGELGCRGPWTVTCDDGSEDRVCILGAYGSNWPEEVIDHILARQEQRIGELKARWTCTE